MAQTKRRYAVEKDVRDKIQVIKILNRLQDHIFGSVELTKTQVAAAQVLLRKALPDLVSTENVHQHEHSFAAVPATASPDEWRQMVDEIRKPITAVVSGAHTNGSGGKG